ncbi:MAG: ATP-binding protein [Oligoflexales bacterium]
MLDNSIEDKLFLDFEELIPGILSSVPETAISLGKEEPKFCFEADALKFYLEDKTFINSLFVHLINNSLDHGLEKAQERVKIGKTSAGHITITAMKMDNHIELVYFDDGRGLNLDRIYEIGLKKSLIGKHEHLKPADIASLIFKDGFSTKKELSRLSGRGIGISAVKKQLEDAGGSISIKIITISSSNFAEVRFLIKIPICDNFQISYDDSKIRQYKAS